MKRLGPINQTNAEALALTASTTLFAVLAVVVSPYLSDAGFVLRLVAAAVGATSLGTFFIVLRRWWASDLNGRQLSAGVMTMMRPDDFRSFVKHEQGNVTQQQ